MNNAPTTFSVERDWLTSTIQVHRDSQLSEVIDALETLVQSLWFQKSIREYLREEVISDINIFTELND